MPTGRHAFRLLDIDESSFRYTLTAYQPGLRGALTYWLGEIDDQRHAYRQWAHRWKASGFAPPRSDPSRPQVRSGSLVFVELAGAAGMSAAAAVATGSGWALLAAVPVLLAGRVADLVATRRCARVVTGLRRTVSDPHEIVEFARAVAARRRRRSTRRGSSHWRSTMNPVPRLSELLGWAMVNLHAGLVVSDQCDGMTG
jgi:hypothetical protein